MIDNFNSMTSEEKSNLLPLISPIFFKQMGILSSDAYSAVNQYYNRALNIYKEEYPDANDLNSSGEPYGIKKSFIYLSRGHGYYYYEDFNDFLSQNIVSDNGVLVLDNTQTIYDMYDGVIEEEREENGVIQVTLKSYNQINSSCFGNMSQYTDFIRICKEHNNQGFVFIGKSSSDWGKCTFMCFATPRPNLYNNGTTLGNTIQICDDNGTRNFSMEWFKTTAYNNDADTYFTQFNENRLVRNLCVGGVGTLVVTTNNGNANFLNNDGTRGDGFYVYTLANTETTYNLFTSLNGWINHQGHYEPSYELGSNYGQVPSAVVNSNQITTYYNNTYTDNSVNGSNNVVYYPPNYDPNSNGYDEGTKTLSFDGIVNFLSSLGSLIGSLINGIAQGLANLVESLISIVNNLRNNLMSGVIFEFLTLFIGWLPLEIVSLLTALFAVTVIFALIKLLKGFF